MYEITIKVALFVIGIIFFCSLIYIMFQSRRYEKKKKKPYKYELYGKITSIQFLTLMSLLVILIACLVIDFFSSSVLEFLVRDLSELPRSTIEIYFSSFLTVSIGVIGVIAIVMSILYGAYMNVLPSRQEHIKLPKQVFIWFLFSLYFIAVMGVLFILPLMNQLNP